jgi:hypothetical protein
MLAELNEAKKYLVEKFGDADLVPPGTYAIPTETSKGKAFMRVTIAEDKGMGDFSLWMDEAFTVKWYDFKKKYFFLTEEFYNQSYLSIDVLNKLVESKDNLVADRDMYQSGKFLFMEVFDNENSREILKKIISDFDAYKLFNNEKYPSDKDTEIGLSALQDLHLSYHGYEDEIMWDNENECFEFRCAIESEED